jgi:uncharacterized protein (UPF0332 family)
MIDDIKSLNHSGKIDHMQEEFVNIKYGDYIMFQLIKMTENPERWVCRVFIKDSVIGISKPSATNIESLYDGKEIVRKFSKSIEEYLKQNP